MSNRRVYISVISMYIMINKESKQTKKTETKGLYNTTSSNHSLNKTGDNKQMSKQAKIVTIKKEYLSGYCYEIRQEKKYPSILNFYKDNKLIGLRLISDLIRQIEKEEKEDKVQVNKDKLKDSDINKEEISTTKENAREKDKGESDITAQKDKDFMEKTELQKVFDINDKEVCAKCGFSFDDGRDLNEHEHICRNGVTKK